jgi:predicted kinase
MSKLTVLVGPPGSGKSTFAKDRIYNDGDCGLAVVYINQDTQGKEGHLKLFEEAVRESKNIIVDRMGFDKKQRSRYINIAKQNNYESEIVVLHESLNTCYDRAVARQDHPTIKDAETASKAINFFFVDMSA